MTIDDMCYDDLRFEKKANTHEALVYGESLTGRQYTAAYVGKIFFGDQTEIGIALVQEETRQAIMPHKINIIYAGLHPTPEKTLEHVLKTVKCYVTNTFPEEQLPTEPFNTTLTRLTYSLHYAIPTGNYEKEMALLVGFTQGTNYTDDIYRLIAYLFTEKPQTTVVDTLIEKITARHAGKQEIAQTLHMLLPETVQKLPATAQ